MSCVSWLVRRSTCSTDKSKPQGGGEATSESQVQTQNANVSTLMATIDRLQQERKQLQKEKEELLAKLATKGTQLYNCVRMCARSHVVLLSLYESKGCIWVRAAKCIEIGSFLDVGDIGYCHYQQVWQFLSLVTDWLFGLKNVRIVHFMVEKWPSFFPEAPVNVFNLLFLSDRQPRSAMAKVLSFFHDRKLEQRVNIHIWNAGASESLVVLL